MVAKSFHHLKSQLIQFHFIWNNLFLVKIWEKTIVWGIKFVLCIYNDEMHADMQKDDYFTHPRMKTKRLKNLLWLCKKHNFPQTVWEKKKKNLIKILKLYLQYIKWSKLQKMCKGFPTKSRNCNNTWERTKKCLKCEINFIGAEEKI